MCSPPTIRGAATQIPAKVSPRDGNGNEGKKRGAYVFDDGSNFTRLLVRTGTLHRWEDRRRRRWRSAANGSRGWRRRHPDLTCFGVGGTVVPSSRTRSRRPCTTQGGWHRWHHLRMRWAQQQCDQNQRHTLHTIGNSAACGFQREGRMTLPGPFSRCYTVH
jgi:hypothetical protein